MYENNTNRSYSAIIRSAEIMCTMWFAAVRKRSINNNTALAFVSKTDAQVTHQRQTMSTSDYGLYLQLKDQSSAKANHSKVWQCQLPKALRSSRQGSSCVLFGDQTWDFFSAGALLLSCEPFLKAARMEQAMPVPSLWPIRVGNAGLHSSMTWQYKTASYANMGGIHTC